MYEIWLMLNIVYEMALAAWPVLAVGLGLWLTLLWLAKAQLGRRAIPLSLGLGAAATIVAFLVLPALDHSSLADMGYWVDWANLGGLALAVGAVAAMLSFPVVSMLRKSPV